MSQSKIVISTFDKTSIDDFTILKNGIDDRIEIIRHDATGFYNITKIATLINNLKQQDNEEVGIPTSSDKQNNTSNKAVGIPTSSINKPAKIWFQNKDTIILINECLKYIEYSAAAYNLKKGTPVQFHGTYVHRYLYDHFMSWLSKPYALKVSIILDNIHKEANKKVIKEKDDIISKMREEMKTYHEESMGVLNETKQEASFARQAADAAKQETIKTQKTVEIMTDAIDDMHISFTETAGHSAPVVREEELTFFALSSTITEDGNTLFRAWRTQKNRIFKELTTAMIEDGHQLIIPPIYIAGSVNVPIVAMGKLRLKLKDLADDHNDDPKQDDHLSMTSIIRDTGLKLRRIKPLWLPNNYITRKDMVDAYLDVIIESQGRSFQVVEMPEAFKTIIEERKQEYNNRVANAMGDAKKHLKAMAETMEDVKKHLKATAETIHNAYIATH